MASVGLLYSTTLMESVGLLFNTRLVMSVGYYIGYCRVIGSKMVTYDCV